MTGPWSIHQQLNGDGRIGIYFEYKGHTVGRFEGSIENAEWMVCCINAAHACYSPMADAVAQEGGFEDSAALWAAVAPLGSGERA